MTVVIDIDHETGDLSQYTSTATDSGDLSVSDTAALAGTGYGLSCLIDDTTVIYGQKDLGSPNTAGKVRARCYIDPNTLTMANTNDIAFLLIRSATTTRISVWLRYATVGGYQIYAVGTGDAGSQTSSNYNITDAPHYVEVYMTRAANSTSADGTFTLWVDGVEKFTVTYDNYDAFPSFQVVRMGAAADIDAGTSGTFYLDELIVNDDGSEIGPVTGATFQAAWARGSNAMIGA